MIFIGVGAVNGLGNTKGCANAPEKIAAFLDVKNFSSLKLNKDNVEEQEKQIYESAKELIKNSKPIFLGGDHSLSYSTCKAFFQLYPRAKLIVFDAHPDCMPPMKEPTHEEWLRALIEREHIPSPKNNILLIGVRKIEAEESKFMIENDAQYIEAREIRNDFEGSLARVKEFLTQGKLAREQSAEKTRVYVSFDIDVLDPSIAGATHYKEQDGISLSEARALIRTIKSNAEIAAADIVELNLDFPSQLETTLNSVSEIANELNRRDSSK